LHVASKKSSLASLPILRLIPSIDELTKSIEAMVSEIREANDNHLIENDLNTNATRINAIYDTYIDHRPSSWADSADPKNAKDFVTQMREFCILFSTISSLIVEASIKNSNLHLALAHCLMTEKDTSEQIKQLTKTASQMAGMARTTMTNNTEILLSLQSITKELCPSNAHKIGLPKQQPKRH
jgi:hypothetical protein